MLQVWVGVPRAHWLNSSFPGTPRNGHGGTELRCLLRRGAAASRVADFKPQPPLYRNNPQEAVNTDCSNKSKDKSHTWSYKELLEISSPSDPGFKGFIAKEICFCLLSSHSDSISCCLMWKKMWHECWDTWCKGNRPHHGYVSWRRAARPVCPKDAGVWGLSWVTRYLSLVQGSPETLNGCEFLLTHWECCSATVKGKFVGSWTSHKVNLASLFISY